jgi:hypothetical protein
MKTDEELDGSYTSRPFQPSGRPPAYNGAGAQPEFFIGEGEGVLALRIYIYTLCLMLEILLI